MNSQLQKARRTHTFGRNVTVRGERNLSLQLLPRLWVKQLLAEGEDAQSLWFTGITNQQPARPLTGQGDKRS